MIWLWLRGLKSFTAFSRLSTACACTLTVSKEYNLISEFLSINPKNTYKICRIINEILSFVTWQAFPFTAHCINEFDVTKVF
jgi:hypothetical protein